MEDRQKIEKAVVISGDSIKTLLLICRYLRLHHNPTFTPKESEEISVFVKKVLESEL
uniref:Uncharacterized protein n=1 Tax=viral metagenome TaxID=1070528 RepID=A0A6H2A0Y3_9ZZZZ